MSDGARSRSEHTPDLTLLICYVWVVDDSDGGEEENITNTPHFPHSQRRAERSVSIALIRVLLELLC